MSVIPTMDWLVVRGRAAFEAHRRQTGSERLAGDHELIVVTREDFERYTAVCFEHAVYHRPVHILAPDGRMLALLCRHIGS